MKQSETPRPVWCRPKEACRLTGLGLTRLYQLLNDGTLKSRKLGKSRLVSIASIEALGSDVRPEATR